MSKGQLLIHCSLGTKLPRSFSTTALSISHIRSKWALCHLTSGYDGFYSPLSEWHSSSTAVHLCTYTGSSMGLLNTRGNANGCENNSYSTCDGNSCMQPYKYTYPNLQHLNFPFGPDFLPSWSVPTTGKHLTIPLHHVTSDTVHTIRDC